MDDVLTINGTLVCENGQTFKLTSNHSSKAESSYDMDDEDVAVAFTSAEAKVEDEDNYKYIEAINANNEYVAVLVYLNNQPGGAGVYPITATYEAGTAKAGDIENSNIYPTFYATLDDEGYVNVPMFLCVDGTVKISYDDAGKIQVVINAINTWGRTATITINAPQGESGVSSVLADKAQHIEKVMERGQILIKKGNRKYNTVGIEVK